LWVRALLGKADGRADFLFDFGFHPPTDFRSHKTFNSRQRVAFEPWARFLPAPVTQVKIFVRADVFFPTICKTFKKLRPTAAGAHEIRRGMNPFIEPLRIAIADLLR
jgi:hypothetical protein